MVWEQAVRVLRQNSVALTVLVEPPGAQRALTEPESGLTREGGPEIAFEQGHYNTVGGGAFAQRWRARASIDPAADRKSAREFVTMAEAYGSMSATESRTWVGA
jgi:hypothetical protein